MNFFYNSQLRIIASLFILVSFPLFGQLVNPLTTPIAKSGLSVNLEDFIQMPSSSSSAPLARINIMKPAGDGSGRLFVNDLRGKLYLIKNGVVSTYLDLAAERSNFNDSPGLGSGFGMFAFHPEFATNGKLYTTHSEGAGAGSPDVNLLVTPSQIDLQWVLSEWTASDPAADLFSGTSREMLRLDTPSNIHGFQDLSFNPNVSSGHADYGMLYLCIGDGGTTWRGYPGNTHDLRSFLGTIIRIDPLATDGRNGQYGIPSDNPYAIAQPDTLPEIWAWGFRNPHRMSWDSGGDGKMLIGEIGKKNIEEVNIGIAGANYGWNVREGTFLYNYNQSTVVYPLPANDTALGFTYPVAQYDHDEGFAIAGGFVYRGNLIPELYGQYLFGDVVNGRIFHIPADSLQLGQQTIIKELTLTRNSNEVTFLGLLSSSRADLRFGVDAQNELYVLSKQNAKIWRLTAAPATNIDPAENFLPTNISLSQNFPNPFNPNTTFEYSLRQAADVRLDILDISGRLLKTLVNDRRSAGNYSASWDGRDRNNIAASSGLYFYRLRSGNETLTRKMILLK